MLGVDTVSSVAPNHPNLGAPVRWGVPKERKTTILAWLGLRSEYVSFNNSLVNLERAVKERVFYVSGPKGFEQPPKPAPGCFNAEMFEFETKLAKYLPKSAPVDAKNFVETYSGLKKLVYERAVDSLSVLPFEKRDAYIKAFVKWEKNLLKPGKHWTQVVPRVISPRSPRFNVMVGVFLKHLEHRIFKAIAKVFDEVTVMKGLDAEASARLARRKWEKFTHPVAIGADASRFDQHVSVQALEWEHSIYLRCFYHKDRRLLADLLKYQLYNRCTAATSDGKFKYHTDGGRMSGDMNTGLGNCLLMCAMMWSWAKRAGVQKFELMNNGDDCVYIVERSDLDKITTGITDYFRSLGFTLVTEEPVDVFERISFCQTQPVFDGEKYTMVRDPRVCLAKDAICMLDLQRVEDVRGWMRAVGQGGLHLTGGIPVLQNAYRAYIMMSAGPVSKKQFKLGWSVRQLMKAPERKYRDCSPEARASFFMAFGISPEEQLFLEDYYDSHPFWLIRDGFRSPVLPHLLV